MSWAWSFSEVEGFYLALRRFGPQWHVIAEDLPGRSPDALQALYERHQEYLNGARMEGTTAAELYKRIKDEQDSGAFVSEPPDSARPSPAKFDSIASERARRPTSALHSPAHAHAAEPGWQSSTVGRGSSASSTSRAAAGTRAAPAHAVDPLLNASLDAAAPHASLLRSFARTLSSTAVRSWALYEYFYSDIDRPFFLTDNAFARAAGHLDAELGARIAAGLTLTRREWQYIREQIGKPRRFSAAFCADSRRQLAAYRTAARAVQSGRAALAPAMAALGLAGLAVRPAVPVGARVRAIHPATQELASGLVLTAHGGQHRVLFDRAALGAALVGDVALARHRVLEPLMGRPSGVEARRAGLAAAMGECIKQRRAVLNALRALPAIEAGSSATAAAVADVRRRARDLRLQAEHAGAALAQLHALARDAAAWGEAEGTGAGVGSPAFAAAGGSGGSGRGSGGGGGGGADGEELDAAPEWLPPLAEAALAGSAWVDEAGDMGLTVAALLCAVRAACDATMAGPRVRDAALHALEALRPQFKGNRPAFDRLQRSIDTVLARERE